MQWEREILKDDFINIWTLSCRQIHKLDNRRPLIYREKSFSNIDKFKNELTSVNWTELHNYNDPYNAYGGFVYQFTAIYNNCFLLKRKKATRKNCLRKPWITSGLLKSIKKKNILYKRFLNNPTADRAQRYKNFKNKLNHCLRVSKRNYYENKLDDYKFNARGTWRILNEVINRQKRHLISPLCLKLAK